MEMRTLSVGRSLQNSHFLLASSVRLKIQNVEYEFLTRYFERVAVGIYLLQLYVCCGSGCFYES